MKTRSGYFFWIVIFTLLLILSVCLESAIQTTGVATADLSQMPLTFVANQGQVDKQVAFTVQGHPKVLYSTPGFEGLAPQDYLPDGTIERVSIAADGTQSNASVDYYEYPQVSADGRYVAFASAASNLVPGDTNGKKDVFLVDRLTNQIQRISMGWNGEQSNSLSSATDMTPDGRHIVIYSEATNLVQNDTNDRGDVFVYDRITGNTVLVSVSTTGLQGEHKNGGGRISDDGRHVVIESQSTTLANDPSPIEIDIFVRDRDTDGNGLLDEPAGVRTVRVSLGVGGAEPNNYNTVRPAISGNGRFVSFVSRASNLVNPADPNTIADIFMVDRDADENGIFDEEFGGATLMVKVSLDPSGNLTNGDASLVDLAPMSFDGRYITFSSEASNLVAGDANGYQDIFARDMVTAQTMLISYGPGGVGAEYDSYAPYISNDGQYVVFQTAADNLVDGDDNAWDDCLIHDMLTGNKIKASTAWDGSQANDNDDSCNLSANGKLVSFSSLASNLVLNDTNGFRDIFIYERVSQADVTPEAGGNISITRELQVDALFPSGAVTDTVNIRLNWSSGPAAPEGMVGLGTPFSLEAYDSVGNPVTSFAQPFTLKMTYQDQHIAEIQEDTLTMYLYSTQDRRWVEIPTNRDPGANQVFISINHMTLFAVFGQPQTGDYRVFLPLIQR